MSDPISPRAASRIHVVGGPGSGKTFLAHQIGARLGIPIYELDSIAFEGPDFVKRPLSERLADVQRIAAQPAWITEGIFVGWTEQLLDTADLIIWLDNLTWRVAMRRIGGRFVRWGVQEAGRQHGVRKFTRFRDYARHLHQLAKVLASSRRYYNCSTIDTGADIQESRLATGRQLEPYRAKVVRCRSAADVQRLLASFVIQEEALH